VIDVRSNLGNPDKGEQAYHSAHLPGAFYFHLERDLSGEVKEHGGNHPLPPIESFTNKLEAIGASLEKPILVYDTENDMFAARLWWLLHYLGHEKVYLLDGGFQAWVEAGLKVTDEIPQVQSSIWKGKPQENLTVAMEEVRERNTSKTILIDSRAKARYLGETEPLYKKAGHIPGAKNYFWKDVLQEDGSWKSNEQLADHFAHLDKNDDIIVSCGSGISACPNYIALKK